MMDATAVEDVAARWVAAWTTGRTSALFTLLAAGARVESNLDPDGDFIEKLTGYAAALTSVSVFSRTVIDLRVALVYDCAVGTEQFRLAEFLVLTPTGLIAEVRRVYDLYAIERLMPDLLLET
ncbi:hypothetical protein AB0K00_48935 [Dactylosporangium sp. NPDC049525]|uniref:hypothetical protein n=1 Tax=Dactylosporangium sp. NPDC049525 TaxID=3154730 RepID=UPI003415C5FA